MEQYTESTCSDLEDGGNALHRNTGKFYQAGLFAQSGTVKNHIFRGCVVYFTPRKTELVTTRNAIAKKRDVQRHSDTVCVGDLLQLLMETEGVGTIEELLGSAALPSGKGGIKDRSSFAR